MTDPARDPARQARLTDSLRNIDLPPSFYNMDNLVRFSLDMNARSSRAVMFSVFTSTYGKSSRLLPSPICGGITRAIV